MGRIDPLAECEFSRQNQCIRPVPNMLGRSIKPGELAMPRARVDKIIAPGAFPCKPPADLSARCSAPGNPVFDFCMQRMFDQPFAAGCLHTGRLLGDYGQAILTICTLPRPHQKCVAIGLLGDDLASTAVERTTRCKGKVLGFDLGIAILAAKHPVLRYIDKDWFGAITTRPLTDKGKRA